MNPNQVDTEDSADDIEDNAFDNIEDVQYKFVLTGAHKKYIYPLFRDRNVPLTGKSRWPGVMVTHEKFKFQKNGSNRSGQKHYWTCGDKPYSDCKARATTVVEEELNPDNKDEPIRKHRLLSVSRPEVNLF